MMDPSLISCAKRVASGDAESEVQFVTRIAPAVRNIVRATLRLRDWTAVDDISQEILWEIVLRLRKNTITDIDRLDHFMCRMARNLAIDAWRRHSREVVVESADDVSNDEAIEMIEREDALRAARVMIGSLRTERDKKILLGVYFHGMAKESLCHELGIQADHFDRVLHRARERLLALLKGPLPRRVETHRG